MKRADKGLSAGQACMAAIVVLVVLLVCVMDASGRITGMTIPEQLCQALLVEVELYEESGRPVRVLSVPAAVTEPELEPLEELWEDYENEYIEQALTAQGYYRDDIPLPHEMQDHMQSACDLYGVPYALALAVCETESGFDPAAENGACLGYMQIHRINHKRIREATGYDAATAAGNIVGGVFMLGELLEKYGDTEKALCCYNAGEAGAEKKYFSQGITSSAYTRKVLERMAAWEAVLYG